MGALAAKSIVILGAFGGCAIAYQCVSVKDSWMPDSKELSSSGEGKYIKDMHHYFVDVDAAENKEWWNWSFNYRWRDDAKAGMSSSFQSVTGLDGFKKVCKDMYSKTETELKQEDKSFMWKYCSPVGGLPTPLSESTDEREKKYQGENSDQPETLGKKKASELISTFEEGNDLFWWIKEKLFFEAPTELGKYDSSKKTEDNKKTDFDKLYDKKDEKIRKTRGSLKNVCRKAYEEDSTQSGDGRVTEEELQKKSYLNIADLRILNQIMQPQPLLHRFLNFYLF